MTDNLLLILLIVGLPTLACILQDIYHRRRLRNRYRSPLVRSAVALARRR